MTPASPRVDALRAHLVVLSDRRPSPGAPRTDVESAIERAVREHDGIWLVRHAEEPARPGDHGAVLGAVPSCPRAALDDWARYVRANASYAERIVEVANPAGAIWIHGHRWLLVPAVLRRYGHRGPIGLWLDVPFPAQDRFEALPWCGDVLASLCQLDLLGFLAPPCAERFEASRARTGRRRPWVSVFPPAALDPAAWGTRFLHLLVSAARRDPRRALVG